MDDEVEDDAEDGPELHFDCTCGKPLTVPVEMTGGYIECPWCLKEVRVPGSDEASDDEGADDEGEAAPDRCAACAALCDEDECPSCRIAPIPAKDWELLPYVEEQRVVRPSSADWILRRARWLLSKQTRAEFFARPLVLPTAEFFPTTWTSSRAALDDLLERMRRWVGLLECPVQAEVKDEVTSLGEVFLGMGVGGTHAAGCIYAPQWNDGVALIEVEISQFADRIELVATLAHELGHLFGFVRLDCVEAPPLDNEPLTDLISVMHGTGIFVTESAHRFVNQSRGDGWYRHGWSQSGYLSQPELAFALALFCAIRGIPAAAVAPHLSLNPRSFFQDSLRFFEATPAAMREAMSLMR